MCKISQVLFVALIFLSTFSLYSKDVEVRDYSNLKSACRKADFIQLGKFAKENVHTENQLKKLWKIALKEKSKKLIRATEFAFLIYQKKENLQIDPGALVQTALFIETKLSDYIRKRRYYLKPDEDTLSFPIEHDPKTGYTFILLEGVKGALLGEGYQKSVSKAILYKHDKPRFVARGERYSFAMDEIDLTKMLHGEKGLLKTIAFTKREENGQSCGTIYSEIYSPGSFVGLKEKGITFTLREKMKIAQNILKGLYAMHKNGIVHRDLNPGNYFINICEGKNGQRKISAVIADFGAGRHVSKVRKLRAQSISSLTAPEGLFFASMSGSDYLATDVFAVGVHFYRLFYNRAPPWADKSYLHDKTQSIEQNYHELYEKIEKATSVRRNSLSTKKLQGELTPEEDFEYLILKMVHPDPAKRGSAQELKKEMSRSIKLL